MEWSPQAALKAYLDTLQLCKFHNDQDLVHGNTYSSGIIEPKCMEFISALAAGKRARLMLQITSEGVTPLTVSLAVAAKQSGGRLIVCINKDDDHTEKIGKTLLVENGLDNVIEYVYDTDPCRMVKHFKNVDFAAVDCKFKDYLKLLKVMSLNPNGSIVVVNNIGMTVNGGPILDQVFKEKKGFKYVTLPLGEGMEFTRFRSKGKCKSQRYKRFHVTFEN